MVKELIQFDIDDMRISSNAISTRIMEMENKAAIFPQELRIRIDAQTRNVRVALKEINEVLKEAVEYLRKVKEETAAAK